MKYLVFGMGGVGASVTERLVAQGKDVSVIARGEHLALLQERGLRVERTFDDTCQVTDFKASSAEDYCETPDVVFICVKGYSLETCYPLLSRCCSQNTVVVPLLNLFGTGQKIAVQLLDKMGDSTALCTDGCIYVAAELKAPGVLLESSPLCRIIFGLPYQKHQPAVLEAISENTTGMGLECVLSDNIRRDALKKYSYVSPMGAAAIIHRSNAGDVHVGGPARQTFADAIREVTAIGKTMGIDFGENMVSTNITIAEGLSPRSTTSMQRDLEAGRQSEFDGLINEVVRLGMEYGVPTPTYIKAQKMGYVRFGAE